MGYEVKDELWDAEWCAVGARKGVECPDFGRIEGGMPARKECSTSAERYVCSLVSPALSRTGRTRRIHFFQFQCRDEVGISHREGGVRNRRSIQTSIL